MLNLIKTDLYRLFHTKAFKIGVIVAAAIALLNLLANVGLIALFDMVEQSTGEAQDRVAMGEFFPFIAWSVTGATLSDMVFTNVGCLSLLVACVVSASFISAEQTSGYVKNVAGQLSHRSYTIISKFLVTSLIHLIILVVYTAVSFIFAPMLFGKYIVSYAMVGELVGALCVRFLLYMAINAIVVFLCTLTKSPSLAMIIGAIFGLGVTTLGYMALSTVLSMALKTDVNLLQIMPDGINNVLSLYSVGTTWVRALIVSAIFIVVSLVSAMFIIEKRDDK